MISMFVFASLSQYCNTTTMNNQKWLIRQMTFQPPLRRKKRKILCWHPRLQQITEATPLHHFWKCRELALLYMNSPKQHNKQLCINHNFCNIHNIVLYYFSNNMLPKLQMLLHAIATQTPPIPNPKKWWHAKVVQVTPKKKSCTCLTLWKIVHPLVLHSGSQLQISIMKYTA